MNLFDKVLSLLKGEKKLDEKALLEAQVCPNCWGKQEYDGEVKEFVKIREVEGQKAFVAKFVETHLDGIKLDKNGDDLVCKKCNIKVKAA